jgi:hypothetical protein
MNAQLSVSDIVKRASALEKKEFETLFEKLSTLRLQKNGVPVMNADESALIDAINKGFTSENLDRLHYLDWKLEFSALTENEASESLLLAEAFENYSVERLKNLSQLAALRKISIDALIKQFGVTPQVHG